MFVLDSIWVVSCHFTHSTQIFIENKYFVWKVKIYEQAQNLVTIFFRIFITSKLIWLKNVFIICWIESHFDIKVKRVS